MRKLQTHSQMQRKSKTIQNSSRQKNESPLLPDKSILLLQTGANVSNYNNQQKPIQGQATIKSCQLYLKLLKQPFHYISYPYKFALR